MPLTQEQVDAVAEPGNVCLASCPGSAKTRTVGTTALACVEDVRGTPRRVACITHTQAASDEIESRLAESSFGGDDRYCEVTTIHSFALRNILGPFFSLLPEFRNGFTIITSDSSVWSDKVDELVAAYGLRPRLRDEFDKIERRPGGVLGRISGLEEALQDDWCRWLDDSGYTTLGDIVYHSGRVLTQSPFIAEALASRFRVVLVDEFQDSSPGQIALLEAIHAFGRTTFFCVGDPNQSIYGFAGARPELLQQCGAHVAATTNHRLTGNFRSSAAICDVAQRLRVGAPVMTAVGDYAQFGRAPEHHVVNTSEDGIVNQFLPTARALGIAWGEIAILGPWWISLFHLSQQLRAAGIPVVGPGARPYSRTHLVTPILEVMGAYTEQPSLDLGHSLQKTFYGLIADLDGSPGFAFRYAGRKVICHAIADAVEIRGRQPRAVGWIDEFVPVLADRLVAAEAIPTGARTQLLDSAAAIVADIQRRGQAAVLSVDDLGLFARPHDCVRMMTVHRAKGREFEAVAVVDAHDDKFPHFSIREIQDQAEYDAEFDESRRVVYVAATRAKRLLMFFSDRSDHRNRPSPFLNEMGL